MTISFARDARPESAAEVLRAARDRRRAADAAEADLLQLAVDWALMHPVDSVHQPAGHALRGFGQTELALAGEGAPAIAEFAVAELASTLGLSTESGKHYLGEALELRYRLPALWRRVGSGDLPAWKARRVARETIRLTPEAAAFVDTHVAPVAHKISPAHCFFIRDLRTPFGGVGDSGVGREGGTFSREFFTEPKAVVMQIDRG